MKKGIFGTVLGLLAFGFVFMFVFIDGGFLTIAMIVPFIFVILIIFGAIAIIKFVNKQQASSGYYHTDKDYQGSGNLKICSNCHERIDKDFKYCPSCGASQKNTIICEYCGHENPKENALCENCNGFL